MVDADEDVYCSRTPVKSLGVNLEQLCISSIKQDICFSFLFRYRIYCTDFQGWEQALSSRNDRYIVIGHSLKWRSMEQGVMTELACFTVS
jgi:hypothetical protein